MSTYGRYPPPRPPRMSYLWPFLLLLVLVPLLLWRFWPHRDADGDVPAVPRPVTPRGALSDIENSNIELYNQALPSVVHVTRLGLARDAYFNLRQVPEGTGSGFIWDTDGHVVTNAHVVGTSKTAAVILSDKADKTTYQAQVV